METFLGMVWCSSDNYHRLGRYFFFFTVILCCVGYEALKSEWEDEVSQGSELIIAWSEPEILHSDRDLIPEVTQDLNLNLESELTPALVLEMDLDPELTLF